MQCRIVGLGYLCLFPACDLSFISLLCNCVPNTTNQSDHCFTRSHSTLVTPTRYPNPLAANSFAVHLWSHVRSVPRERKGISYVSIRDAVYNSQQCSRLVGKVHNPSGPLNSTGTPESLLLGKEPTVAFSVDRRVSDSTPKCVSPQNPSFAGRSLYALHDRRSTRNTRSDLPGETRTRRAGSIHGYTDSERITRSSPSLPSLSGVIEPPCEPHGHASTGRPGRG